MQYCLLMHYREASDAGVTAEDIARGRAAFAVYADDLDADATLSWARRCPAADWGTIEIRPVAVTYAGGRGWYQP